MSSAFCWNIGSQGELMFRELTAAARRPCVPAGATLSSRSRTCPTILLTKPLAAGAHATGTWSRKRRQVGQGSS